MWECRLSLPCHNHTCQRWSTVVNSISYSNLKPDSKSVISNFMHILHHKLDKIYHFFFNIICSICWSKINTFLSQQFFGICICCSVIENLNARSQGLHPLRVMLTNFYLFPMNIKRIEIRFEFLGDQEKKWGFQIFIWVLFHYIGTNFAKKTSLWKFSPWDITL